MSSFKLVTIFYENITKGLINGLCIWKLKSSSVIHTDSRAEKVVGCQCCVRLYVFG